MHAISCSLFHLDSMIINGNQFDRGLPDFLNSSSGNRFKSDIKFDGNKIVVSKNASLQRFSPPHSEKVSKLTTTVLY